MSVAGFKSSNSILTGSLTEVSSGVPYLLAGTNVTITTGSNGQITINSTGGGGGSGDITSVIAGTGLDGGGTAGDVTLTLDTSNNRNVDHTTVSITGNNGIAGGGDLTTSRTLSLDFSSLTGMTGDISGATEFILQDGITESRKAASEIKLSKFVNDSGWTTNAGTVTSVGLTAGNLIDITGSPVTTSGNITVDVDLSELTTSTLDADGDYFVVVDSSNAQKKLTKANINLSGFNNDLVINTNDGDWTDGGNKLLTTSSVSIDSDGSYVDSYGSDIYFYVSGSNDAGLTSPNTGKNFNGVAAFGGDVVLSGSLYLEPYDSSGFTVSRSLIFGSKNTKINSIVTPDNLTDLDVHSIGLMRLGNLNDEATGPGNADVNVFISGSIGSKNSSNRGTLLVGGDLVISGSIYDKYSKSIIKKSQKSYTGMASTAANNAPYFFNVEYSGGNNPASQSSTLYNVRLSKNRGSVDSLIVKFASTQFGSVSYPTNGITASCYVSDNINANFTNLTSSEYNSLEIIKKPSTDYSSNYSSVIFNFTGSFYNPGSIYVIGLNYGNNWNSTSLPNPHYIFYDIETSDFID